MLTPIVVVLFGAILVIEVISMLRRSPAAQPSAPPSETRS